MRNLILTLILFFATLGYSQQTPATFEMLSKKIPIKLNLQKFLYSYDIILSQDTVAQIRNYANGYIVISKKDYLYPIKAFSTEHNLDTNSNEFKVFLDILRYDYQLQLSLIKNNKTLVHKNKQAWHEWLEGKITYTDSIGPLLKSEYGQVNCKDENGNYIYVTNYYTPNHYAVGCVALVLATTMRYYNWPIHGVGSHTYTDDYGNSTGTYTADFGSRTYEWTKIQDKYYKVPSTVDSRKALGRVAFDAAVSVDMDFEADGSTSNINRIPAAVSKYFRYDRPLYKTSSASDFWQKIDSSIFAFAPVQLAVYTESGAGHAIVADGLIKTNDPSTQLYHLNMGWWGSQNGWYTIQSDFNAGGYSIVSAAVMGMLPIPEINEPQYDFQNNKITISWNYPVNKVPYSSFVLQMRIDNSTIWQTIAENIEQTEYTIDASIEHKYYFRVKETRNINWSQETEINPQAELEKLKQPKVFPTYAYDHIYIQYLNLNNSTVRIFDQSGNLMITKKFSDNSAVKEKINLPLLKPGLYYVQLITKEGKFGFRIIILGEPPVF